jgi:hypothetical protein
MRNIEDIESALPEVSPVVTAQPQSDYGNFAGVGFENITPPPADTGTPYRCTASVERLDSIDDLPRKLRKWVKTMIRVGYNKDAPDKEIVKGFNEEKAKQGIPATTKPYPSRSEAVYAVVGYCKFAGVSDGVLLNILTDPRWQISAHCIDNGGVPYAQKQVEQWRQDHPQFVEQQATGDGQRPEPPSDSILDEGGRLLESIAAMEAVLLDKGRPVYQRGEFLVRPAAVGVIEHGERIDGVVETTRDGDKIVRSGGVERTIGTPTIRRVSAAWIQREVAMHSKWCKRIAKGFAPIDPPSHVAAHILDKVGEWQFPVLNGILCTPTIRPDGSLLDQCGYDPATGLILDTGGVVFPSIPQNPTIDDARAALAFLASPYRAYIFADNGSNSVLLAALLTAIYRPMMQHAPMFNFDASDPGSGKGKLAKCVGMMALGRRPAHMNLDPRDTEFITALSAVLLAGDPVIWIDNISRPLGGIDLLDSAITESVAKVRILGVSETRECPCRALLLGTGNNITLKGDMPRRVLVCRIESDVEKPEEKKFGFDPVKEFAATRPAHVAAALTILRAYIISGKPGVGDLKPFGSFDDLDVVRGAVTWLGQRDPCDTRVDITPVDDAKAHFAEFVSEWHRNFGDTPMTMSDVRKAVLNNPTVFLPMVEAMRVATKQPIGDKIGFDFDPRITGRRLDAKWKGKVSGGLKFLRAGERDGSALWQVVKVSPQMELPQSA